MARLRRTFFAAAASRSGAKPRRCSRSISRTASSLPSPLTAITPSSSATVGPASATCSGIRSASNRCTTHRSQGGAWAAASEVQAFFRHPDFSTAWDEIALWERRVLGFAAFDRTSFEAIRQVPPGARVTLSVAAPPRVVDAPKDPGGPRDVTLAVDRIADDCAAVLRKAVARRISHSEHFPVAIALSGGIDSTIIAGLSGGHPPGRVVAVTIGGAADVEDAAIWLVSPRASLPCPSRSER